MNRKSRLATLIIFFSTLCWLSLATAAQPLTSRSATAAAYIERGSAWAAKGEWERAIADYDLAITSDPSSAEAWHNRGTARYFKRDFDDALADFNRALQLDPRLMQAYAGRGGIR